MSDAPLTFDNEGTVTVRFKDRTVVIADPEFEPFEHFLKSFHAITERAQRDIDEAQAAIDSAKSDAAKKKAEARAEELGRRPFYELTIPWLQDLFAQLGDGPVPDVGKWPAWLVTDISIPSKIIHHWRMVPKASGETPTD